MQKLQAKHAHKVDIYKKYQVADFVDEIIARYGDNFVQVLDRAQKPKPRLYHFDGVSGVWTWINTYIPVIQYLEEVCRDWEKLYREARSSVAMDDKDTSELNDKQFEKSIATFQRSAGSYRENTKVFSTLKRKIPIHKTFAWNQDRDTLNFRNGILHIPTGQMRPRRADDYVTETLDWDYSPTADIEAKKYIYTIFRQIQPEQEQYDAFMRWLGYNITGHVSEQIVKFNLGDGFKGKSLVYEILQDVAPIYVLKLNRRTFNKNYEKRSHKSLIQLLDEPVRIAFVEELDQKLLDPSKIKYFATDQIRVERLYGTDGNGIMQAKLNVCSDYEPKITGGVLRHCRLQDYPSVFARPSDRTWDEENPRCFRMDTGITLRFKEVEYKNALFHILITEAQKWYKEGLLIPADWVKSFGDVVQINDPFQQWFEAGFEKQVGGCVSKKELLQSAQDAMGKSVSWSGLRQWLKHVGMYEYQHDKRVGNERGAIMGIRKTDGGDL